MVAGTFLAKASESFLLAAVSEAFEVQFEVVDIGPLINLGTQHDGRSARTWMKRVLTTFCVVVGGRKGFAREHQNEFLRDLK